MQPAELIETATKRLNVKENKLAEMLDVPFQHVSGWKTGVRTCPPDMRARLARLCGLDPAAELAEAVADGLSETRRAGLLEALHGERVFYKLWNTTQVSEAIRVCLKGTKSALHGAIYRWTHGCSPSAGPSRLG